MELAGCAGPGGPPPTEGGHWHHLLSCSLLEESFVTKDPFTPDKDRFLILGSKCSICGRLVCVGPVGKLRRQLGPPSLGEGPGTPQAWLWERSHVSLSRGWYASLTSPL